MNRNPARLRAIAPLALLAAAVLLAGCPQVSRTFTAMKVRITEPGDGAVVTSGTAVRFGASVKGGVSPYDVSWDFGGAAPGFAGKDPGDVVFSTPGTWAVTCRVEDAWGQKESSSVTVVVVDILARILSPADGAAIPEGGSADVQGSVQGGTPPFTFAWDFGGGAANSTLEDPGPVTFTNAGSYTVTFTVTDSQALSDSHAVTLQVLSPSGTRTQADIRAYWTAIQPLLGSCSYSQNPVLAVDSSGFEGRLDPQLVTEGVAWTNFYRWLAGLPDTVTEDATFAVRCQQGAHVLVMLNSTGPSYASPHDPPLPTGASSGYEADIYGGPAAVSQNTGGWLACASSNIFRGWGGSAFTPLRTVDGYMDDFGNDATLGHRRWILYPRLSKTAFGTVWNGTSFWASVMYVVERPGFTAPSPPYAYVAYPSQGYYPLQCFTRATALWSFSVNAADYDLDATTYVTVVRRSDAADLGVTTQIKTAGYGITPTISFDPGEATKDETYDVVIHAVWDKTTSQRFDYAYSVTFFDLTE